MRCLPSPPEADPEAQLRDVIRWVTKHLCAGEREEQARLLIRRLEAARDVLERLRS